MILALVLLLTCPLLAAEPAQPAAAAPQAAAPETDWFHNPAPWLDMGADLRFREHYGYNWTALDDDLRDGLGNNASDFHFERYRARWWTKIKFDETTAVNTKMTWEFRTWDNPASRDQHTDFDEIIIDNLNLSMKHFLNTPTTATIGRQDIMNLGKGWLIFEGTPLDGSRTMYFDAARFTIDVAEKTKLDLIYIKNQPSSDWWLKPINDRNKFVTQEEEHGAIVYLTDKSTPTQFEGYFIYKNNNPVDGPAFNFSRAAIPRFSKKAEIFTLGGAISAPINENWNYRVEGAFQGGTSASPNTALTANDQTESLRAFGGKGDLEYGFKDEYDNRLHVVYEYLSGDDPGSKHRVESFNPLWGQWPQWSELFQPYVTQLEDNLVSNLQRVAFGHKFKPNKQWDIYTDYHLLYANENTFRGGARFSDHGKFRGHLLTAWARYNFSKHLKGNLVFEHMWPGGYYSDQSRDNALYFHWTVEYTF